MPVAMPSLLGLDSLQDFEAALEVVELAEGLLPRVFQLPQLVLDAGEPLAGAGGCLASLLEARLGGGGTLAQLCPPTAIGDEVQKELPATLVEAVRFGAVGRPTSGALRSGALLPDALFEGGKLAAELLGPAMDGRVFPLGSGEGLAGTLEGGAKGFDFVGQLHGAPPALEVGGASVPSRLRAPRPRCESRRAG